MPATVRPVAPAACQTTVGSFSAYQTTVTPTARPSRKPTPNSSEERLRGWPRAVGRARGGKDIAAHGALRDRADGDPADAAGQRQLREDRHPQAAGHECGGDGRVVRAVADVRVEAAQQAAGA